jgi:3D-(3,5/4)-trihydroxycyclohexane-1,2-dione acylhydrolase (decyclizing)
MAKIGSMFGTEFRKRDSKKDRLEGDYIPLDFAKNAASMGAVTWNVKTIPELRDALHGARHQKGVCVIVVETEKHRYVPGSGIWWDVAPAEVSNDAVTKKLRRQFEKDRKNLQRFHY